MNFELAPTPDKKYGFAGQSQISREAHFLFGNTVLEMDLTYVETVGDHYYFRLPHPHPGHEYYQGCSGAPILDDDGNLLGLVTGGIAEENIIHGVALKHYKIVLDIETGQIPGC